jgi:hypothetical protein
VEGLDAGEVGVHFKFFVLQDVEGGAYLDVLLGKVVAVGEGFADLVGVIRIFLVLGGCYFRLGSGSSSAG